MDDLSVQGEERMCFYSLSLVKAWPVAYLTVEGSLKQSEISEAVFKAVPPHDAAEWRTVFNTAVLSPKRNTTMLSERLKKRLDKDPPMTSITLRIPVAVVESMREIAPLRGFSGYQTLLKSYVSEGLRRDEERYTLGQTARLIEALRKRGVPEAVLEEAARDVTKA
ncbi:hypothetical protein ACW73L_15505 [Methylolobus aquaticus]